MTLQPSTDDGDSPPPPPLTGPDAPPAPEPPRHLLVPLAGLLFLAAAIGMSAGRSCIRPTGRSSEASHPSTRQEIRRVLEAGPGAFAFADTTGIDTTWAWVVDLYEQRGDAPVWSGREPHRRTTQFVDALQRIGDAGLEPRDYDTVELTRLLAQATSRGPIARLNRARTLALLDVRATYVCLRVAPHLRDGHIPRAVLDPDWTPRSRTQDWLATLRRPMERNPAHALAELEPRHEGYRRLRDALARYREIAAHGGWPKLTPGPPLALGATGPRVAELRRRLAITGEFPASEPDTVYDRRLVHAIGELQTRQGIPRSGILGEATRSLLDVPVDVRIRQMELNLERWRWLPDDLGTRRIEVNIPAYRLELIDDGEVRRSMRVVVGKRHSPTPVFSDELAYIDVNPTWTLPPSVVSKEIVPALRKNPDYLVQNRMHVISIADAKRDTVDPRLVPWKQAASDSFLYLIIQDAGPENPLGQVKIMCPNEYDVYLHDSPQRGRFEVAQREYSHGCVRVEEAIELADSLVGVTPEDTLFVDSLATRGTFRRLRITKVPVHFLYWTAWADDAGRMCFRDDIYGLDGRLDQALRARTPAQLVLNPGVAVSAFWLAAEARAREAASRLEQARQGRRR